jgi:hypothetical protein
MELKTKPQSTSPKAKIWVRRQLINALKARYPELKGLSQADVVDWALRTLIVLKMPRTWLEEKEIEKEAE